MDPDLYTQVDPAVGRSGAHAPSLREEVYVRLREAVLGGEFAPRERLAEMRLADRFGVSRTPVREALARLLADGLVERGDEGFRVTVPTLDRLTDLYELGVTLELRGMARVAEDPAARHDAGVLTAELRRWHGMREHPPAPDHRFVIQEERFHAELCRASGNRALTEALVTAGRRVRRVRMYDFLDPGRVETAVAEHIEILELVLAGRVDEASRALHVHLGDSPAAVAEHARRAMTQMALHAGRL
ncbi:GntR family transcriptional regulator [Streptomyces ruber]|uniref:GntR family transcriptional regulator n=2 Tax=Streptomyces TaxID=1883 RepID=A0A918B8W7_9ACTN|nr:GntR family transcriptional regulator [Streptomyces ruber]GGQ46430.1 GntR family transcriptional regulator [Streptomyces ruber]